MMRKNFFPSILILLICQYSAFPAPATAENKTPKSSTQSVETLMATLNETLAENRKIRAGMESLRNALETTTIENNVLTAQLTKLRTQKTQLDSRGREQVTTLEQKLSALSDTLKKLESENAQFDQKKKIAEGQLGVVKKENAMLKRLLGTSILASERDQYVKIIEETEKAASQAVQQISEVNLANQKLKQELTQTHFHLANTFTEARYYKSAVEEYRKALEFDPSNPWLHYNIAVLYDYYLEDNQKALLHYREYLHLKPAKEKALRVRERVLDLKMLKKVTPQAPLNDDFIKLNKKDN